MKDIKKSKLYKSLRRNSVVYFIYEKTIQKFRLSIINKSSEEDKKEKIENVHALGYQIVDMTEKALDELELSYFADYGTLLGFVRERDFIAWDDDLDYGFILEDASVWKKIEAKMKEYGFSKIREFTFNNEVTEQCYQFGKASIDLFGHKITPEGKTVSIGYYRDSDIKYKNPDTLSVLYGEFVNLSRTITTTLNNGVLVHIPEEYDKYLSDYYGDWHIPNPDFEEWNGPVEKKMRDVFGYVEHF